MFFLPWMHPLFQRLGGAPEGLLLFSVLFVHLGLLVLGWASPSPASLSVGSLAFFLFLFSFLIFRFEGGFGVGMAWGWVGWVGMGVIGFNLFVHPFACWCLTLFSSILSSMA